MSNLFPPETDDPNIIATLINTLLSELSGQNIGAMLQLLRDTDISFPRLVALTYLQVKGPSSISEISDYLQLALATTSHVVDQLVRAGHVERREDEHDRRLKQVTITPSGTEIVIAARRLRLEESVRRLSMLPPELRSRLYLQLATILVELCNAKMPS